MSKERPGYRWFDQGEKVCYPNVGYGIVADSWNDLGEKHYEVHFEGADDQPLILFIDSEDTRLQRVA